MSIRILRARAWPLAALALLVSAALPLAALVLSPRPAHAEEELSTTGTWVIESWTQKDATVYSLSMRWGRGHDHWGSRSVSLERVPGLKSEQISAARSVVHFEIVRDAG